MIYIKITYLRRLWFECDVAWHHLQVEYANLLENTFHNSVTIMFTELQLFSQVRFHLRICFVELSASGQPETPLTTKSIQL